MIVMVFCGSWLFVSQHKHLLVMLLGMEMMMLGLFSLMSGVVGVGEGLSLLMLLIFAVCEGCVGLGVLVSCVRSHGSDMLSNFNILQC